MALRRRRLSQRRRAVGLTQESLAHRLGVERSTVARWEAGHTEPLPSIRPNVARALQVSTDQLAELLTESEDAKTTRALSSEAETTMAQVQSEVWLGRAEFENLIRPQVAETVEASAELGHPVVVDADTEATVVLDRVLSGRAADIALPADIDTANIRLDMPVRTMAEAGGFAGSAVPEPAQTNDVPDLSSVTTIPLHLPLAQVQWRRARPQRFTRFTRFAAAGVLVLVGGMASVSLMTSHNGVIPPAAGNPARSPVAAIPGPDPGSSNSPRSNDFTGAPAAAPDKPADDLAPSGATAVPTPKTTQSGNRATRSTPPGSMTTPVPPRPPAIPTEVYSWSEKAGLSDQDRARLRPQSPPRP